MNFIHLSFKSYFYEISSSESADFRWTEANPMFYGNLYMFA